MSATGRTNNYNLPVYENGDKTTWADFNAAMEQIDGELKGIDNKTGSISELTQRVNTIRSDVNDLQIDNTNNKNAILSINARLTGMSTNEYITFNPKSNVDLAGGLANSIFANSVAAQVNMLVIIHPEAISSLTPVDGYYRIPVSSISSNLFGLNTSTKDDNSNKYYIGVATTSKVISGIPYITPENMYAYWSGSETVFYALIREEYVTADIVSWLNITTLNGNIIL